MGVHNFRLFLSLRMWVDLNLFLVGLFYTSELTWKTFKTVGCLFFWQGFPNSQQKFLFVNSDLFFCQKKKTPSFFESSPCWLPGPPKNYFNRAVSRVKKTILFLAWFCLYTKKRVDLTSDTPNRRAVEGLRHARAWLSARAARQCSQQKSTCARAPTADEPAWRSVFERWR